MYYVSLYGESTNTILNQFKFKTVEICLSNIKITKDKTFYPHDVQPNTTVINPFSAKRTNWHTILAQQYLVVDMI